MIFSTTIEERMTKKLEEEKNYLWDAVRNLDSSLKECNKSLATLEQNAPEHFKKTLGARNKISEIKNKVEEKQAEIEKFHNEFQSGIEMITSIQEQSTTIFESIKKYEESSQATSSSLHKDLQEYLKTKAEIESALEQVKGLINEKDNLTIKIESLSEQVDNSDLLSKRLKSLLSNASKERDEIKDLHGDVFGFVYEDDDGIEREHDGLKSELDTAYNKIKDELGSLNNDVSKLDKLYSEKLDNLEEKYSNSLDEFIAQAESQKIAIVEQIKSLLPDALTAGLSGAYIDKIKVEKNQLDKHEKSFNSSIKWLIACSSVPVFFSIARVLFLSENFEIVLKDAPLLYSMMLPVYAPILWVAYSSNKSYKLSKRLIEEYTHKEVSSRTFEGLSNQISNIGENDTSNELRTKLLYNLLQVNSENPGKLISDYNNSDHPIIDAIDKSSKLADAINKLDNVPLVSPLLKHLNAKEKMKLDQKAQEMANVVDVHISEATKTQQSNEPAIITDKEAS